MDSSSNQTDRSQPSGVTAATVPLHSRLTDNSVFTHVTSATDPPTLALHDGTLEALKWLALVLMTGDHVNKFLLNSSVPALYAAGRLAMPLFIIVLAYNLARPNAMSGGSYRRTMYRLAVFGALAMLPAMVLRGSWWTLNILFTLAAFAATLRLIEQGTFVNRTLAACVFAIGGAFVEFGWPALLFGVGVWWYLKHPSWSALALSLAGLASIGLINDNQWALATIPVLLIVAGLNWRMPRIRWVFYAYYPAHLIGIWLVRAVTA